MAVAGQKLEEKVKAKVEDDEKKKIEGRSEKTEMRKKEIRKKYFTILKPPSTVVYGLWTN